MIDFESLIKERKELEKINDKLSTSLDQLIDSCEIQQKRHIHKIESLEEVIGELEDRIYNLNSYYSDDQCSFDNSVKNLKNNLYDKGYILPQQLLIDIIDTIT